MLVQYHNVTVKGKLHKGIVGAVDCRENVGVASRIQEN